MRNYSTIVSHLLAIDCIVFGYDILEKKIKLLLIKRSFNPGKGKWSLPGGFLNSNESLDEAATRILYNLTGLRDVYMKQLYTFGEIERDPGARVISITYYALIKIQDIDKQIKNRNAAHWRSIMSLPGLLFDHSQMFYKAMDELKRQVKVKPVGFKLLPDKFTLVQLQDLYESVYQRNIDKRNFRKKILSMNLLQKLDEKDKKTSKRGAYYFTFNTEKYNSYTMQGFYFNLDVN
jgi:8-oxo-dGTP diphosphatase